MSDAKYLFDSYLRELDSRVVDVKDGKFIVLDDTVFYPSSGGQPNDTGVMVRRSDSKAFNVVYSGKFGGNISHEVSLQGLAVGDEVRCIIDWDRRYKLMRMHTAAHVLTRALHNITGSMITGNQLEVEESRVDGNFEYRPEIVEEAFIEANSVVAKDLPIRTEFISREEAEKMPLLTRLAKGLPPDIRTVRILSIGDYDSGADGGTHVRSTKEVGRVVFSRYNSKGKDNKRVYFKLE